MTDINSTLSVVILNVKGLILQLKDRDLTICWLKETHFRFKDTNGFKVQGWKKVYHANSNQREPEWLYYTRQNRL